MHSVSEKLASSEDNSTNYEEDEKENKRIKDVLKSLPLSVEFLEEEKKQDNKTEIEEKAIQSDSRKWSDLQGVQLAEKSLRSISLGDTDFPKFSLWNSWTNKR